ncbi:BnaA02g28520D [Brassica napus]|uniref:BnaA02g28520D protein n=2 Tax=Brassica TaxID=3705 RepID=A0A078HBL3_BRANA|nr:BnaA02g28520D [Brassica napus]
MDTIQKEKEKEKEAAQGDRSPKVRAWPVVKERNCKDSSRGKMYGEWVIPSRCEVLISYCANCELMID